MMLNPFQKDSMVNTILLKYDGARTSNKFSIVITILNNITRTETDNLELSFYEIINKINYKISLNGELIKVFKSLQNYLYKKFSPQIVLGIKVDIQNDVSFYKSFVIFENNTYTFEDTDLVSLEKKLKNI